VSVPCILLRVPGEAALACGGVSDEFFNEHIRPEVNLIHRGRFTFVATAELERWAEANGERWPC
jgi:hypothetical protein